MKTNIVLDHEPVADGGWLVRALLKIEGEARLGDARSPLNLSLVLDRSGSMGGAKLAAVKRAAALLVKRLAPSDTLSVIAYDDAVTVVAPPSTGDAQPHLVAQIEALRTGGTTNLSGGWLQGRQFVADGAREGSIDRVLLLTDGLANVGVTDPAKLIGLCRNAAARGVMTTTIGFGRDYDEELLTAMADAGGGGAHYIEEPDEAPVIFEEELAGLLSIAAQNVRVSIHVGDAAESCRVHHVYPSSQEDGVLSLDLGDLYAREPRPLLAEFLMKPPAEGAEEEEIAAGLMVVTGDVLTADGGIERRSVRIPIRFSPVEGGIAVPEVRREMLLLEAAREREVALQAREPEELEAARARFGRLSERLSAHDPEDPVLREEAADLGRMAEALETGHMVAEDAKYLRYRARYAGRGERKKADALSRIGREKRELERRRRERGPREPDRERDDA